MPTIKSIRAARVDRGVLRRLIFFNLVTGITLAGTWVLADIFWRGGLTRAEIVMLGIFVPLFGMVALGFVQAVTGFVLLSRRQHDAGVLFNPGDPLPPEHQLPVSAIVMPIHNEDVVRVYEALRAMYLSLIRSGYGEKFHFFILSDTRDINVAVEEEAAWLDLCKQVRGFGRIFYRRRRIPLNRKSGNVSDFCRRWGRAYPYMIVLDADSVMEAQALVRLVALMEKNPGAGIIQTVPRLAMGHTPFARMMQFSSALYGPLFSAGLDFWQQDEGNYWGHNAILRLGPFMEHCALPELPLSGKRDTRFMSHDYVEAALMRQAGYQVWLAVQLEGSYEGGPPTLLDHARRDRRWCRGNLQHAWLLAAPGIHPVNRLHLFLGILSYLASPLWLLMLTLGIVQGFHEVASAPLRRFDYDVGLSSFLDIGGVRLALTLFTLTMIMLVMPKVLAMVLALSRKATRQAFGGAWSLVNGVLLEQVISTLIAPVLMLFNSRSVVSILMGRVVNWAAQPRDEAGGTKWSSALRTHAGHVVIGAAAAVITFAIDPTVGWWFSPVWLGLLLAVPLTVWLDRPACGQALGRWKIFATPTETAPPAELKHLQRNLDLVARRPAEAQAHEPDTGLARLILDPYMNAAHKVLRWRTAAEPPARREYFQRLEERLLREGPTKLNEREKKALLLNPYAISRLHMRVWQMSPAELAPWWSSALQQYNLLTNRPPPVLAHT